MSGLCEGGNEPAGSLKASRTPGAIGRKQSSSVSRSDPVFGLTNIQVFLGWTALGYERQSLELHRKLPSICSYCFEEKPGKNLNQVTCRDRDSNPGLLVPRPDALTVTPQVWTDKCTKVPNQLKVGRVTERLFPFDYRCQISKNIEIDDAKFETVQSFVYLGSLVNSNNDISEEINRRTQSTNRCYYVLQKQVKSSLLSRGTKCRLYKTLIKPVLTYASETWPLSERDKFRLAAFERKILRRIFGPVRDGETWRIRYNNELYQLYESPDIITSIKIARLRWAGHVKRMDECEIPRKVMEHGIAGGRRVGRPKLRWMDCVMDDIKRLGVKNWWTVAEDRDRWRRILKEAEARSGL
ncbi:hypothetical protein ANN_07424 [Periplaneta americana]|uniref:Uncharacterized protein n=1 Tax=Periplaneta americana TaxID=6978 RepID=A0ABQ8SYK0_PERAM|nr:hypothetical protein ANN_07424 [Periplaneta americana]